MTRPTIIPNIVHSQLLNDSSCARRADCTSKYRNDRLMHRLYLLLLQHITREQRRYEQHDQNEQGP